MGCQPKPRRVQPDPRIYIYIYVSAQPADSDEISMSTTPTLNQLDDSDLRLFWAQESALLHYFLLERNVYPLETLCLCTTFRSIMLLSI